MQQQYYDENVDELIVTLQSLKKYQDLTRDEIIELFDTVEDLKNEIERLTILDNEYQMMKSNYDIGFKQDMKTASILTGNMDINYKILLNLNLTELSRYCQSNSVTKQLCNNRQFWLDKFVYDGLDPYIAFREADVDRNNILYNFNNHFIFPNNINEWLKIYNRLIKAKKYSEYCLTIFNTEFIVNNVSYIEIKGKNELVLLLLSYMIMWRFNNLYTKIMQGNELKYRISFEPKINKYIFNTIINDKVEASYSPKKEIVLKFLNLAFYYRLKFGTDIFIVDKNDIEYVIHKNALDNQMNQRDIKKMYRRYGMFQILDNNKKTLII